MTQTCRRYASNSKPLKLRPNNAQMRSAPKKRGNVEKRKLLNEPGANARKHASA